MRILIAPVILAAVCIAPAAALETARSLAAAGAPHLALTRVEQLQPRDPGTARWAEWEALRLGLLVELKRNAEALKRAAELPANLPQPALRQCLLVAARAAVAVGQGPPARAYAARLLWQFESTAEEARAIRLLVIESYLVERQVDAAFRAMLRFEQDYRPLDRATVERFVSTLLDAGMEKEAVNWLAGLDDAGPLKLQLRARTGLVAPDTAVAQARAQIAKGAGPEYWQVLAAVAVKQGDGALRVEALERLLHHAGANNAAQSAELWLAYVAEAQSVANQTRLLTGDDNAWLDFAARRLGANPTQSRALFAYLSRNGVGRETRLGAQLQLVFSLFQSGLDFAALRLFGDERVAAEALDTQARYLLGNIAESRNAPALAARFWLGLPPPPNAGAEEWPVRLATMQWRAGMLSASLDTMRVLFKQAKAMPNPAAGRAIALAREMSAMGKPEPAEELYAALLPLAGREHVRDILYALGGIAESAAQHARAAAYYLRAALADESRATDMLALQARLAAATNLARAGFRDDARAQLQWLLGHSKDPSQLESARRELSRL
jgi:hypothetical protein